MQKFERNFKLPPFKFYSKRQQMKELMFEIQMENKREEVDRSEKVLEYLHDKLSQVKSQERFEEWS